MNIEELYKEIAGLFPTNTCETCYLHQPGNYTREDCVTYNKRLCALDKANIERLTIILEQAGYSIPAELKVLSDEELWDAEEPCFQDKPCPFGISDEPANTKGNDAKCTLCGLRAVAQAQLEADSDIDLASP